jgi:uncharacterized protein (DUF433 family)
VSRQILNEARRRGEEFMLRLAEVVSVDDGTPVFRGTDVPVQTLLDRLRAGASLEQFAADFPSVGREEAVRLLELAVEGVLRIYEGPRRSSAGR